MAAGLAPTPHTVQGDEEKTGVILHDFLAALHTVESDEEKTRVIHDFLAADDEDAKPCLVVIGAGGTGKTHALRAALRSLPHDMEVNVYSWNHGELPGLERFSHNGAFTKWVVFRGWVDDLTRGLVAEWVECRHCGPAVWFMPRSPPSL
jgi:hypothetical protein